MDIRITPVPETDRKPKPADDQLGFGAYFTDHMVLMDYDEGNGWFDPRIVPYADLRLDPAAMVLHYNQEVFEGLKAYALPNGGLGLFRPEKNIARMNNSARRMRMPEVDTDLVLAAMKRFVRLEQRWVPTSAGTSLYLRPTMIANEPALGVRPSKKYLFYVIASPVGAYYPGGFHPTKIFVAKDHIRAARGGVGEAKTSGNYGPTLMVQGIAAEKGYSQVLWLDANERKYIEEVGTSNIFFVLNDELVTPPLDGTILPGITRDSVLAMARHWGLSVRERKIAIDEVVAAIQDDTITEIFASGTAAVISPVGTIGYDGTDYTVAGGKVGPMSQKFYDTITGIQYGRDEDPFGWRVLVD